MSTPEHRPCGGASNICPPNMGGLLGNRYQRTLWGGSESSVTGARLLSCPTKLVRRYLGHMNWNALLYNPDNSVAQACESGTMWICFNCDIAMTKPFTAMTWVLVVLITCYPILGMRRCTC
jgi:hypothetical protein